MATQYEHSLFASSWCLPIPLVIPHVRKKRKRNIQMNFEGNSAQSHYVLFLEIRNAQGGTSIVSWKRSKRKIRVCFLCFLFPVFRLRPYFQVNSRFTVKSSTDQHRGGSKRKIIHRFTTTGMDTYSFAVQKPN